MSSSVLDDIEVEENKHRFGSSNDDEWKVNVIFDSRLDGHVLLIPISTE